MSAGYYLRALIAWSLFLVGAIVSFLEEEPAIDVLCIGLMFLVLVIDDIREVVTDAMDDSEDDDTNGDQS